MKTRLSLPRMLSSLYANHRWLVWLPKTFKTSCGNASLGTLTFDSLEVLMNIMRLCLDIQPLCVNIFMRRKRIYQ